MRKPKNRKLPPQIPGTMRAFRRRKRAEWVAVRRAFDTFRYGCAYANLRASEVGRMEALLAEVHEKLSPAKWGR